MGKERPFFYPSQGRFDAHEGAPGGQSLGTCWRDELKPHPEAGVGAGRKHKP